MKFEFTETGATGTVAAKLAPAPQPAPPLSFDLPRRLLAQLAGAGLLYLGVMAFAFRAGQGIGIIFAVFFLVLLGYYGLPLLMGAQSRRDAAPPRSDDLWFFPRRGAWGIDTASGHLSGRAAWAQVMTVPVLMVLWALAVAILH
jgi:hypothetical protein